jgi:hypothetical protein
MAITNPTKLVSVQRLGRFKEKLDALLDEKATKEELIAATIIPVNLETMTPSTTFVKNNILFINGVGYRAKQDTTHFPVVLLVEQGQFVVDIVDGAPAYVVSDYTLNSDWEVWGDASVTRTLNGMQESLDESLEQMEHDQEEFISEAQAIVYASIKPSDLVSNTLGTKQYTVQQLLTAMAALMDKRVLGDPITE